MKPIADSANYRDQIQGCDSKMEISPASMVCMTGTHEEGLNNLENLVQIKTTTKRQRRSLRIIFLRVVDHAVFSTDKIALIGAKYPACCI